MVLPVMINQACRIVAETGDDASYFFGFHDLCPWNRTDDRVVLLRVDPAITWVPTGAETAEVVLWSPRKGTSEVISETTTWNYQAGARAMWLPGTADVVAFNRNVDGKVGCEMVDIGSGARRILPFAINAVSPDGAFGFAAHFARLGLDWPAYGYQGLAPPPGADKGAPDEDGLWRLDLATGDLRLLVSIKELATFAGRDEGSSRHFVTHVSVNRSGTRLVFMHRFMSQDHALYTRLFASRLDGSELSLIAEEKVSHFDWLDDDTLLVWLRSSPSFIGAARRAGLLASPVAKPLLAMVRRLTGRVKGALLQEYFHVLSLSGSAKRPFHPELFTVDGHPMQSPDGDWIVVDTYPNSDHEMELMLYDKRNRRRVDLARFFDGAAELSSDVKCDLHPRWNRGGTQVGVDTSRDIRRCFTVLDVAEVIR